jgi:GntR family transcriptional regulator, vanillate catabolism transcriptional regulator
MTKEVAMAGQPETPLVRVRLVDDITERLRRLILDGVLEPGQKLRQVELAERLGVSRTPLREAFRVLEHDGFVRIANANQTVEVVDFTTRDVIEMYEIREVVDGLAARLLARLGLSEESAGVLESCLSRMEAAIGPFDLVGYTDAHVRFHTLIVSDCGNQRMSDLMPVVRFTSSAVTTRITRKLWDQGGDLTVTELVRHQLRTGSQHHRTILDAILARQPERAEEVARHHIRTTIRNIEWMASRRGHGALRAGARTPGSEQHPGLRG